jgi:hypothetical protein
MTDPIAQARAGVNRDVIDGPQTDHEKLIYEYEKRIFALEVAANKARAEGRAEGIREASAALEAVKKHEFKLNGSTYYYVHLGQASHAIFDLLDAPSGVTQPAQVSVKPLEWDGNGEGNYPTWWAIGLSFRAKIDKGSAEMYGDYPLFINGFWDKTKHKTLEAAKAAAQADYEARIMAALEPTGGPRDE